METRLCVCARENKSPIAVSSCRTQTRSVARMRRLKHTGAETRMQTRTRTHLAVEEALQALVGEVDAQLLQAAEFLALSLSLPPSLSHSLLLSLFPSLSQHLFTLSLVTISLPPSLPRLCIAGLLDRLAVAMGLLSNAPTGEADLDRALASFPDWSGNPPIGRV
jgi:hypothetical protein